MICFPFQKPNRISEVKMCYHEGHFRGMCSDFEYFTFRWSTTFMCVCIVCIWCLVKSSNPVRAADRPVACAAVLNLLGFRKPGLRIVPRDREMLRALWSQPGLAYRLRAACFGWWPSVCQSHHPLKFPFIYPENGGVNPSLIMFFWGFWVLWMTKEEAPVGRMLVLCEADYTRPHVAGKDGEKRQTAVLTLSSAA